MGQNVQRQNKRVVMIGKGTTLKVNNLHFYLPFNSNTGGNK